MSNSQGQRADRTGKSRYKPSHTLTTTRKIINVIPGDFNHDGRLDLLIMSEEKKGSWWNGEKSRTMIEVHLGAEDGGFREYHAHSAMKRVINDAGDDPWFLDPTTEVQGIVYDDGGSMKPSILAFEPDESGTGNGLLKSWHNDGTGLKMYVSLVNLLTCG